MKSITKRRRKFHSSGRKTQHQHKNQHINRASHTKQNKSHKKIMMGGVVEFLQRFRNRNKKLPGDPKWDCKCHYSDAEQPPELQQLQQLQQPPQPPQPQRQRQRQPPLQQQPPQPPPPQQRPQQRPPPPQTRAGEPNLLLKSISRNKLDGPSEDGRIGLNSENLFFVLNGIRLIGLKGHPLPESFHQSDIITHINGNRLDIKVGDTRKTNVQKFKDLTKGSIGERVKFTVKNNRGGGIPPLRIVVIELSPEQTKGGRKMTYRHKKHLTSRNSKSHNKKKKVMVGGALPPNWKSLNNEEKINFINQNETNINLLDEIYTFEKPNDNNIDVRQLLIDKLDGAPQPPPPPNLITQYLRLKNPSSPSASASASLPHHQAGTLPPPDLVNSQYASSQQSNSDDEDVHVVDVGDVGDVGDDNDADGAAVINHPHPVKRTRTQSIKSNKQQLTCDCTKAASKQVKDV